MNRGSAVWLPSVIGRIILFLFVFNLLILFLYFLGNFQDFLDSTQVILLFLFERGCFVFIVGSAYYAVLLLSLGIGNRSFRSVRFIFTILGIIMLGVLLLLVKFLGAWFEGS